MEMFSISPGLIFEILPVKGTPSTTYNGSLEKLIEPKPRIRISALAPGWPLPEDT